jgi:cell division protein ZapA (FtsZ GTPase activity inhibitor)
VIVWDAEDPASDVVVRAAYSCARALAQRSRLESKQSLEAVNQIDRAVRAIEKQVGYLDEIRTSALTAVSSGRKIVERSEKMKEDLAREVARLDEQLGALRTG